MAEKMDKYKRNLIVKDLAINSAINILKKLTVNKISAMIIVQNLIGFRVLGLESKTGALWRGKIKLKNVPKSLKFRCGTFSCIWGPIWGPIIAQ